MDITDLHGLESKYAHWRGELIDKLDEIDHIENLAETLSVLRERTQELRELIGQMQRSHFHRRNVGHARRTM